ncbi:hypothetical protein M0811_11647 [Anaeramoeba ignava]|uniref:Uncharacterized protein n=1 Tax=Anaeramoeba ignava TaxID=1746090 RepID=A0A9Q0LDD7_ANAIG|nr:hypothetical protein M0811_11647 [Anaeramoeba ignava]
MLTWKTQSNQNDDINKNENLNLNLNLNQNNQNINININPNENSDQKKGANVSQQETKRTERKRKQETQETANNPNESKQTDTSQDKQKSKLSLSDYKKIRTNKKIQTETTETNQKPIEETVEKNEAPVIESKESTEEIGIPVQNIPLNPTQRIRSIVQTETMNFGRSISESSLSSKFNLNSNINSNTNSNINSNINSNSNTNTNTNQNSSNNINLSSQSQFFQSKPNSNISILPKTQKQPQLLQESTAYDPTRGNEYYSQLYSPMNVPKDSFTRISRQTESTNAENKERITIGARAIPRTSQPIYISNGPKYLYPGKSRESNYPQQQSFSIPRSHSYDLNSNNIHDDLNRVNENKISPQNPNPNQNQNQNPRIQSRNGFFTNKPNIRVQNRNEFSEHQHSYDGIMINQDKIQTMRQNQIHRKSPDQSNNLSTRSIGKESPNQFNHDQNTILNPYLNTYSNQNNSKKNDSHYSKANESQEKMNSKKFRNHESINEEQMQSRYYHPNYPNNSMNIQSNSSNEGISPNYGNANFVRRIRNPQRQDSKIKNQNRK